MIFIRIFQSKHIFLFLTISRYLPIKSIAPINTFNSLLNEQFQSDYIEHNLPSEIIDDRVKISFFRNWLWFSVLMHKIIPITNVSISSRNISIWIPIRFRHLIENIWQADWKHIMQSTWIRQFFDINRLGHKLVIGYGWIINLHILNDDIKFYDNNYYNSISNAN